MRQHRREFAELQSHAPRREDLYQAHGEGHRPSASAACQLPSDCTVVASLVWSISSAHVFAIAPAGTATAVALQPDGSIYAVPDEAVGGAEWPKDLESAAAIAASLCDTGALLAARFHPVRRGQRLPRKDSLAPSADLTLRRRRQSALQSPRPRSLGERMREASAPGGIAAVSGQLGRLRVHSGLRWATRVHEEMGFEQERDGDAAAVPVVAHVAWTVGERIAITGDSQQPCLCVWERNESAVVIV
jgi:hypothetical protein